MISQTVYDLCHGRETISSELARDATLSPGSIAKRLYRDGERPRLVEPSFKPPSSATAEDLQRAAECGNFGPTRPSELFLRVYHDVLATIEHDPLIGVCSPPLLAGLGVVPLTVISTLVDICRHMSNCIVRAEREVFLATNYWMASDASKFITNALGELSARAVQRGQTVVVKVMYDRGNAKQVFDNHQDVSEAEYTGKAVQLPPRDELPNLEMQVVNYHRPIFGTFHAKFMVVDRTIGILSSNNIQDNENLEMMTRIEGPMVDALYDGALISWHNALQPPLPCRNSPAATAALRAFAPSDAGPSTLEAAGPLMSTDRPPIGTHALAPTENPEGAIPLPPPQSRPPPTDRPEHTSSEPHYDVDIAGEAARVQASLRPRNGESHTQAVSRHLNGKLQPDTTGDAPEPGPDEEMTPYIVHPAHDPFPMAMLNRKPWGAPNHSCVHTPQNEGFLSAIRHAQTTVFIQTPNLNAEPLLPALLDACRRGVEVTIYVCLGYNDAGELLPFQGGTNEMVAHKLYSSLADDGAARARLRYHYYVGKDQTRPIHKTFKKRACHIKLLIVDGRLAIQGNGNQDTQSWFHSQEMNVLFDSPVVCRAWLDALRRNQNTHRYGRAGIDDGAAGPAGVWRDDQGREAEGAIGVDPGRFAWAKGIVGAVQRVRGAGGF
ncbi:MAG: hypothetical protein M1826_000086 [Phylliscum demangeonii]|nr:MAG: hypothetical protein M1826_000086 [Phylliscum demangeonii]